MRPLQGVVVVAVEQAVAAPFATRHLVDLGARVIKIERPGRGDFARDYDSAGGEGLSSWFLWLNRGKESVALDLKNPDDADVLQRLLARADVFVENLAPGAAARLGLAEDELRQRHPRLVTCSVSGYGATGPYRERKAYDLLIQAESGLLSLTGTPDAPARAGLSVVDIAAGMYAYSGVLAALLRRGITGEGGHVAVSLLDTMVEWLAPAITHLRLTGVAPQRTGARHPSIAPYGPYRCGDGREVVLAIQNAAEWQRFCSAFDPSLLEDEALATNERRIAAGSALDARVTQTLTGLTLEQVCERLDVASIAWGRRNELADVLEHEQVLARGRWVNVGTPAGDYVASLPPVSLSDSEPVLGAVPALGEHTASVLAWLATEEAQR